jgi:folate-binding Fe-S cluster repair protein YgfZ
MTLYEMKDNVVLRLYPNAANFLKGLSANTIEAPHNAFTDVQGRAVAVFDQLKISNDEALLVVRKTYVEPLQRHLKMYLDLNEATLIPTSMHVYYDLKGNSQEELQIQQKKFKLPLPTQNYQHI